MKPQEMLDLPEGAQVKLVGVREANIETYILSCIPIGTVLTRQRNAIDDIELSAFAHSDLQDGYDFFYADELELVNEEG